MKFTVATVAVILAGVVCAVHAQIYNPAINLVSGSFNNPPPVDPASLAHRVVVQNAAAESQLPPELLRSTSFYANPRVAAGLAKESWLTNKEFPVFHRDAEDIPREAIAKIIYNAGFHNNRR